MTGDDAAGIARGGLTTGLGQLRKVMCNNPREFIGRVEKPALGHATGLPTYKDRIHDGRSGAVNVN